MATTNYEVLVDELTVHKKIADLVDPITKTVVGVQQGQGKIYFKGEVIPGDAVSPKLVEALENDDHPAHESVSRKIRAVSSDAKQDLSLRLGLPFDGYDDMDEDDILAAMRVLPSSTIQAIKHYEAEAGQGREQIVDYMIGFAQSPGDIEEGRINQDTAQGDDREVAEEDKKTSVLTTREVPEDGGPVQRGEGITGTGDPAKPYGSEQEKEKSASSPGRRQRRSGRQQRSSSGESSGGSSE